MEWRLARRPLDLAQPLAAGIVNVTADSMFAGARSGTPEQAVADGLALAAAGFDMLDVGAVAAKSGPPVTPEDEAAALVPAVAGLARRGDGFRGGFPTRTRRAGLRRHLLGRRSRGGRSTPGAAAVNDISGGSRRCSSWSPSAAAATC